MKLFKTKLTKKYVLIVLVVVLFILISLYFITIGVLHKSVYNQVEYRDRLIAKSLGTQVENVLEKSFQDIKQITALGPGDGMIIKNTDVYRKEIKRIISSDPLYLFFDVYENDERRLRIPEIEFSGQVRNEFILDRLSWSQTGYISPTITLPDGRKTIAIAQPIINKQGEYSGSVVAYVNLQVFSYHLDKLLIGQEGLNAIIDKNGTIIAHTQREYIGESIKDHDVQQSLEKERFGFWIGEIFNKEMVISYRPLLGEYGLLVGESFKQAMAPTESIKRLILSGSIVVFLIALTLTLLATSRVVRPVLVLINQVKEYKEGKQKVFRVVKTNDEIEELSHVMSEMAQALRDEQRRLYHILESIPYCVITTDKEGRIMTFNRGAENLTLFSRNEVIGKKILDLPIKNDIHDFVFLKTLQEGKEFEEVESYILDKEKKLHDVRIYSSRYSGDENQFLGSIIVIRDVSELKKLEEYLKQSERLASLGRLTAGIAHEIKNPLSIIQAAAEAIQIQLEDLEVDEIIAELTNDILESTERMNKLLTDFLHLTKKDTKEIKEVFMLDHVINELIHLLRRKFIDKDIQVRIDYETSEAKVIGDKHRFIQALLNLLLNSIQAIKEGGEIEVSLEEHETVYLLKIKDSGEGIPAGQLKWIFNPFYSTKPEGTGLGLSITHEIIVQHDGEIWVENNVDKGTIFTIQLPKGE